MAQALTKGPKHHFFGFHDLCPWDVSQRYILAMEADFIDRPPTAVDNARICLIDTEYNNQLRVVAETRAWNFHQGARLQWLPNSESHIIYNDRAPSASSGLAPSAKFMASDSEFVSVILDVKTGEKRILPAPIYTISPDGKFGLGLNFARLKKYGGYGYALPTTNYQLPTTSDDGIFRVDFGTGEVKLVISIYDAAHLDNVPRNGEYHFLTHINFNPSGTSICFIDKYRLPDGGFMQRLITANPDGSDLYVLPGHVSHFCWRNDAEIFGFGKFSPRLATLRSKGIFQNPIVRPLLYIARKLRGGLKQKIAGQSYLLLKDKSQEIERIAVGIMTEDGHPQFSPDGNWVITDTYADKNHHKTLILYNWNTGERIDIARPYSLPAGELANIKFKDGHIEPWDITEMRADLHPRWNNDGTKVCIDSVHEGTRQMYVVDVSQVITNNQ